MVCANPGFRASSSSQKGDCTHLYSAGRQQQASAKDLGGCGICCLVKRFQAPLGRPQEAVLAPVFPFLLSYQLLARCQLQIADVASVAGVAAKCLEALSGSWIWRHDLTQPERLCFASNRPNIGNGVAELLH